MLVNGAKRYRVFAEVNQDLNVKTLVLTDLVVTNEYKISKKLLRLHILPIFVFNPIQTKSTPIFYLPSLFNTKKMLESWLWALMVIIFILVTLAPFIVCFILVFCCGMTICCFAGRGSRTVQRGQVHYHTQQPPTTVVVTQQPPAYPNPPPTAPGKDSFT